MRINKHMTATAFAILALAAAAPAIAADYDPPVFVEEAEEFQPVEIGSGWYLRGDLGYAIGGGMDGVTYRTYDALTDTYVELGSASADIEGDFGGGVGFGYRFTDFLRADVTADIFKASFEGTTLTDDPCLGGSAGTGCRTQDSASGYRMSYLANAYVDLGTYSGLTPYAGAGIGVSRLKWDRLTRSSFCVDGAAVCPAYPMGDDFVDGVSSWRMSYALMAGAAYDVDTNLKLDFGYRFLYVDGGDMFSTGGPTPDTGTDEGHNIHEVKLGFRYELW